MCEILAESYIILQDSTSVTKIDHARPAPFMKPVKRLPTFYSIWTNGSSTSWNSPGIIEWSVVCSTCKMHTCTNFIALADFSQSRRRQPFLTAMLYITVWMTYSIWWSLLDMFSPQPSSVYQQNAWSSMTNRFYNSKALNFSVNANPRPHNFRLPRKTSNFWKASQIKCHCEELPETAERFGVSGHNT